MRSEESEAAVAARRADGAVPAGRTLFDTLKAAFKIAILTAIILSVIWPVRSRLADPAGPEGPAMTALTSR
jgi:hypothetical protein